MTGTERKVFQKYYPPDFDPSKIPRAKGQRNKQFIQRVMAPYNMQCNTCHEYIYKGKKFNMRRETADGELYLGLKIFRFYFRCPNCLAEITFKTDLENCDYQQEHGATRLFEAFKLYQQEEKAKETKEEEEKKDPMKMLERRTKLSRAEMEALGKLEELQETNRQHEAFGTDQYLQTLAESQARALRMQEQEDEKFIRSLYGPTEDGKLIKRLMDDDEDAESQKNSLRFNAGLKIAKSIDQKPSCSHASLADTKEGVLDGISAAGTKRNTQKELLSKIVIVKKPKTEQPISIKKEEPDHEDDGGTMENLSKSINGQYECKSALKSSALLGLVDYGGGSSGSSSE